MKQLKSQEFETLLRCVGGGGVLAVGDVPAHNIDAMMMMMMMIMMMMIEGAHSG